MNLFFARGFFILFLSLTLLKATEAVKSFSNGEERSSFQEYIIITVSDYCSFLNDQGVNGENDFYDQKMASDTLVAFIVREGEPGSYSYSVISGHENDKISYVSLSNKRAYYQWLQNGLNPEKNWKEEELLGNLKSNNRGFSLKKNLSHEAVLSRDGKDELLDSTSSSWEGAQKIAIATGIFLFGYRMIQGYGVVPDERVFSTDEIKIKHSASQFDQQSRLTRPTSELSLPKKESSWKIHSSCSLNDLSIQDLDNKKSMDQNRESTLQTINRFHKTEISKVKNKKTNLFHNLCITANEKTVTLKKTAEDLEQLNHNINTAKKKALAGLCNYGKVYVVAHASTLLLDMVVPFGSVSAHLATEVAANIGYYKPLVAEAAIYITQTVQGTVMSKGAAIIVREHVPHNSLSSHESEEKVAFVLGEDLAAVGSGVSNLASERSQFGIKKQKFLEALKAYQTAIQEVDLAYRNAVEEEAQDKQNWESINRIRKTIEFSEEEGHQIMHSAKKPKNPRRATMRFAQGYLHRENATIPLGGFSLNRDKTYYRLYAKDHPEDLIGAHLLDKEPSISLDNDILVGEVHIPQGTRMQQLDFKISSFSDGQIHQARLIDIISKDCFKALLK